MLKGGGGGGGASRNTFMGSFKTETLSFSYAERGGGEVFPLKKERGGGRKV